MAGDNARSTWDTLNKSLLKEERVTETYMQEGSWPSVTGSFSSALGVRLDPLPGRGETGTWGRDARQEITAQGLQFLGVNQKELIFNPV